MIYYSISGWCILRYTDTRIFNLFTEKVTMSRIRGYTLIKYANKASFFYSDPKTGIIHTRKLKIR